MDRHEQIIDLKRANSFLEQYVDLRNQYCEQLLTQPVGIEETKQWLKGTGIEVIGISREGLLSGVAILYLHRDGEIAFFVKKQKHGTGSRLLKMIERVARDKKIGSIWGWVLDDNIGAKKAFIKQGYILEKEMNRNDKGVMKRGIIFRKLIQPEEER